MLGSTKQHSDIPESLKLQLSAFQQRLWRAKLKEVLFLSLSILFISLSLHYCCDRLGDTPTWLRTSILSLGLSGFLLFLPYQYYVWNIRMHSQFRLAKLIEKTYPYLGDRLWGIFELDKQERKGILHSTALQRAAILQVARECNQTSLDTCIPHPTRYKRYGLFLTGSLILLISLLIYSPSAFNNTLKRWISPQSNIARYTFSKLLPFESLFYVPTGESFEITFLGDPQSEKLSDTLHLNLPNGSQYKAAKSGSPDNPSYTFRLHGLFTPTELELTLGDAFYSLMVEPHTRPNVQSLSATIQYPEYMGKEKESQSLKTGTLYVPKGSTVDFLIESNNTLKQAEQILSTKESTPLSIQENKVFFPPFLIDAPKQIKFQWTDIYGLQAQNPPEFHVTPIEDKDPQTIINSPLKEYYVLENETLKLPITARDDYGLRNLGVLIETQKETLKFEIVEGAKTTNLLETDFTFQAKLLNLSPQTIRIKSFTQDFCPDHSIVLAQSINIYILDKNTHAQYVKKDLERLLNDLEEVEQQQQTLLESTRQHKQDAQNTPNSPEMAQQLKELAEQQENLADSIKKITQQLEKTFENALKNDAIDTQSMRPFYESFQQIKKLPDSSQKSSEQNLQKAAKASDANQQQEAFQEAEKAQQDTLDQLSQIVDKLQETSKKIEAGTLASRLKKIAQEEQNVVTLLKTNLSQTLGLLTEELTPDQLENEKKSSEKQIQIMQDVRWIMEDIRNFSTRTEEENYKAISLEIQNSFIDQRMESLSKRILDNHLGNSLNDAKKIIDLFLAWAEKIDKTPTQSSSQNNGDGNNSSSEDDMTNGDFDFMLKMMRMLQKQIDLREQTRNIETYKRRKAPQHD